MASSGFWETLVNVFSKCLHYMTGFIVHPDKGGCCYEKENKKDK